MANAFQSGSIFVDTTGSLTTKSVKVAYILYTPDTANDIIIFYDGDANTDPVKLKLRHLSAKDTEVFDFSARPLVFQDGIYVTVPSNGTATLILTSEGGGN